MKSVVAGVSAAVIAYILNRIVIAKAGNKGIVSLIPFVEEVLKSLTAVYLGGSLVTTHLIFGAIEASYEIFGAKSPKEIAGGFSSLATHGALGLVTSGVWVLTNSLWLGIGAASLLHSLWNRMITGTYTRN